MTDETEETAKKPEKPKRKAAPRNSKPSVRHFRVQKQVSWGHDGVLITLPKGTVITSETHDIDDLVKRGVPLESCEAPESKPT